MWIKLGDKNTKFFIDHRQARARLWKNNVKEIIKEDGLATSSFTQVKEVSFQHFSNMYSEPHLPPREDSTQLLDHIPLFITQ